MSFSPIACVRVPLAALQAAVQRTYGDQSQSDVLPDVTTDSPPGTNSNQASSQPLVVLPRERPSALVQEYNRAAAALGVQRGMTYSEVLSLSPAIGAVVVNHRDIQTFLYHIRGKLERFSPVVEQWRHDPAVFWLQLQGMHRLYQTEEHWCSAVMAELQDAGIYGAVACGPTRQEALFVVYCGNTAGAGDVPITVLPLPDRDVQRLRTLGVTTVQRFREVAPGRLAQHCTIQSREVRSFLDTDVPLTVDELPRQIAVTCHLTEDVPLRSRTGVYRLCNRGISSLIQTAKEQQRWIQEITLILTGEDGDTYREVLRSRDATRDDAWLGQLLHLRLERVKNLPAAVRSVDLTAQMVVGEVVQDELFQSTDSTHPDYSTTASLDLRALRQAVERIEGICGNGSVCSFEEAPGWEPIQSFRIARFTPVRQVGEHTSSSPDTWVRVRRIISGSAAVLTGRPRQGVAPHHVMVSTGWWRGHTDERVYEYVPLDTGHVLWRSSTQQREFTTLLGWVE